MTDSLPPFDSFLLLSFGGPEGPDDVMPFLENVLRGKNVPRERMIEVAEHYEHFGGISPINEQNRKLLSSIEAEFVNQGIKLPVYWGNRNWHPMLDDTLTQMRDDGRKRALAFFTSMFSCYSGCRQYRENIEAAQAKVGPDAPIIQKVRMGFNHPGFIHCVADGVKAAIGQLGITADQATVMFTAHSIPMSMADHCDYKKQLLEACHLVAQTIGVNNWELAFQSRSGPPQQPWLDPDICDVIEERHAENKLTSVVIAPIGFVSDHMEVMYDLDEEAAVLCKQKGIEMSRAATPGDANTFVKMIAELVKERLDPATPKRALGSMGPWHDVCPVDCCLYTPQRPAATRPVSAPA
jgi:protoporphyrin/coproporphyrin ferrochelatase